MGNSSIPRISIVVITYNQNKLIERALSSILVQREYVYEIIVCDDCSTDSTWDVIIDYTHQYPKLIKPYRNEHNLGIFGNIENSWSKPTGDMVMYLAGDDTLCNGLFENAINLIKANQIDFEKEMFCLYFDFKITYPNNKLGYVRRNSMIAKGYDPVSLKIRGLISNMTVIYSTKLMSKFTPIRKDIGFFADGLIDIQVQMYAESNYYSPFVGSIYYAKVGVSTEISKEESYNSIYQTSLEYKKMLNLSKKDMTFLDYKNEKIRLFMKPTLKQLFLTLRYHEKCIDWKYGIKGLDLRQFCIDSYKIIRYTLARNNSKI